MRAGDELAAGGAGGGEILVPLGQAGAELLAALGELGDLLPELADVISLAEAGLAPGLLTGQLGEAVL